MIGVRTASSCFTSGRGVPSFPNECESDSIRHDLRGADEILRFWNCGVVRDLDAAILEFVRNERENFATRNL
jgi:hypothetical protein